VYALFVSNLLFSGNVAGC